jgi:hypothetical protein
MARPRTIAIACLLAASCSRTWTAEVTQPGLVLDANVAARTSMPLVITLRDMEMGRYPITNSAYYVVVSRDRLRFHITMHHKWDDVADPKNWTAYVEDADGQRHYPEGVTGRVTLISTVRYGSTTYSLRNPFYRGTADLTVYGRDLFAHANRLTLVLVHDGYEYRYRWISGEIDESWLKRSESAS